MKTAEEALTVLKKSRSALLERARYEAVILCQHDKLRMTYSRAVRDAMERKGVLPAYLDERWMGALFACEFFESTTITVPVQDSRRNIHRGRDARMWRLKEEWAEVTLTEPPPPEQYVAQERVGHMDKMLRLARMAHGNFTMRVDDLGVYIETYTGGSWKGPTLEGVLRGMAQQVSA